MNDPLGAMSKGLSSANQKLKENAQYAAESIKNNEDLKQKLKTAKEKAASGIAYAKESSSYAAERFKENANTLYEKNYHGQLAEGIGQAYTSAAQRATEVKKQIAMRNDPNYSQRIMTDDGSEMQDNYTAGYNPISRPFDGGADFETYGRTTEGI